MPNFENRVRDVIERSDVPPVSERHNTVNISSEDQLSPVSGGTRTLSSDTGFVFDGTVDISEQLELSQGTGIYGLNWPTDQINYTGTGTLFQGSDVDIMMRNIVTNAANGTLFDVSGTSDNRFTVQSCAFLMSDDLGTIDGFKVPGFKLCDFTNFNAGLTFTGNPNKVFTTSTVHREVSNVTAITFDSNFTTDFIEFSDLFFKAFNNNSDAINFDPSATLNERGFIRGCLFENTVQNNTVNFNETTIGWKFTDNNGIQDSDVRGLYTLDSETTTTINSQANSLTDESAYEKIEGSTTASSGIERFSHSNNQLQYVGRDTNDLKFDISVTVDGVNDDLGLALFENQSLINVSAIKISAQGANAVNGVTFAEVQAETDDQFEVFIANLESTSNPNIVGMTVRGSA